MLRCGDICIRTLSDTYTRDDIRLKELVIVIGYKNSVTGAYGYDINEIINKFEYTTDKTTYISSILNNLRLVIQHIAYIDFSEEFNEITKNCLDEYIKIKLKTSLKEEDIFDNFKESDLKDYNNDKVLKNISSYNNYLIKSAFFCNKLLKNNILTLENVLSMINTRYEELYKLNNISLSDLYEQIDMIPGGIYMLKGKTKFDIICCIGILENNNYVCVTLYNKYSYDLFDRVYAEISTYINYSNFLTIALRRNHGKTRIIKKNTGVYYLRLCLEKQRVSYNYSLDFNFKETIVM